MRVVMSVASAGAAPGSVRSASRAISVSTTMFFFSTVVSSVSACAKATTTRGWPMAAMPARAQGLRDVAATAAAAS